MHNSIDEAAAEAANSKPYRVAGTTLRMLDVNAATQTVELGNIHGGVTYRWSAEHDRGCQVVEVA